ncbi:response regulator transcription factor [Pontibacterium sp.]|uniref:response regulator transcription factor n=1 Tax=Pontibacterium sp. TaxID=2036026 RepID=UPI0035135060
MRLLLVEDDPQLAEQLSVNLHSAGYIVDVSRTASEADYKMNEIRYDIAILDLGLPDRNGIEVLTGWRSIHNHTPVLVLTARSEWEEKISAFRAGADDYLCKPFHRGELEARLEALLRRSQPHRCPQLEVGGVRLEPEMQQAVIVSTGESLTLTSTEYRLLQHFMRSSGRIISRQQLLDHLYQFDHEPESNIVESYIRRLRLKLGKGAIVNKRFQGYIFRGVE